MNLRPNYQKLAISPGRSRQRSLLRDVARGLGQQMFFWGCDVRHASGNLLVHAGMERLARAERRGEGSSRYRMEWGCGLIELHSYCFGWYSQTPPFRGAIFIRRLERLASCAGPLPVTPGKYEREQIITEGADELLHSIRPLLDWIISYERNIRKLTDDSYRDACWRRYLSKTGARPWLSPSEAESWFESFLKAPEKTQRPRELLRSSRPPRSPSKFLKGNRQSSF